MPVFTETDELRILLIQPEWNWGKVGFSLAAMPEPLALEKLAASTPGHDVRILDMRFEESDSALEDELRNFSPDMVAVTALTTEVYAALDVLQRVRRYSKDIFNLVGGHHATLNPQDFYAPQVDAIALGECEAVMPNIVAALSKGESPENVANVIWRDAAGEFHGGERVFSRIDMDTLPLPRRDLTKKYRDDYFFLFDKPDTSIATGRGCPYRCNFCSVWVFYGGRTRQMSPQRVVKEVRSAQTEHITFVDDNFLMNYQRERQIAEMIKAEGIDHRYSMECRTDSIVKHPELLEQWVDVGLYAVLLGLEGASDEMLKNVNKKNTADTNNRAIKILKDNGVIIWGAFIVDPDWQEDDFKRLRDYVNRMEITHTQFTVLTPLPGTNLYSQWRDRLLTHDYTCYDALHAVVPTRMDREDFYAHFANLYRQMDLGPYYDLVREGKLSIEDCRRGKQMLDIMSVPEFYFEKDPVLGGRNQKYREHGRKSEHPGQGGPAGGRSVAAEQHPGRQTQHKIKSQQ